MTRFYFVSVAWFLLSLMLVCRYGSILFNVMMLIQFSDCRHCCIVCNVLLTPKLHQVTFWQEWVINQPPSSWNYFVHCPFDYFCVLDPATVEQRDVGCIKWSGTHMVHIRVDKARSQSKCQHWGLLTRLKKSLKEQWKNVNNKLPSGRNETGTYDVPALQDSFPVHRGKSLRLCENWIYLFFLERHLMTDWGNVRAV